MKGIDIYSDTIITDWCAIKESGVQAVMIKATDGCTYVNPKMDEQYKGAKSVGLLVGFYHFAERNNPQDEYNHFKSTIEGYKQDLRPCLDYEVDNPDFNFIDSFMANDSNLILYCSHSVGDTTKIHNKDIWIAEPGTNPTDTKGYVGIQYDWHGNINGITGDSDVDLFADSILNSGVPTPAKNISCTAAATKVNNGCTILQHILNRLLDWNLVEDGIQGPKTTEGIKTFQEMVGLTTDGIAGQNTWGAINTILAKPLCGIPYVQRTATKFIQYRLGITNDGIFGSGTAQTVKNYQAAHGLEADGIVGPATWGKLIG